MFEAAPLTGSRELRSLAVIALTALALVVAAAVYLAPGIAPPRVGPAPKVPTLVPHFAAVGEIQFADQQHGVMVTYTNSGNGAGTSLFRTENGGQDWAPTPVPRSRARVPMTDWIYC